MAFRHSHGKKFLLEPGLFRLTKYAKGYSDIFEVIVIYSAFDSKIFQ